jgi:hypothetical protein
MYVVSHSTRLAHADVSARCRLVWTQADQSTMARLRNARHLPNRIGVRDSAAVDRLRADLATAARYGGAHIGFNVRMTLYTKGVLAERRDWRPVPPICEEEATMIKVDLPEADSVPEVVRSLPHA